MTYKEIFSLVIESNLSEYVCVFCFMGLSLIEKKNSETSQVLFKENKVVPRYNFILR